ncbi:DUF3302 domain-containing protein [Thalassoglobus sp.]|uniref:DUF3302 domain-containing protein n=1 Tax=Thalassoglobus sp. TaxID=2795869 RepID=UPI003AA9AFBB
MNDPLTFFAWLVLAMIFLVIVSTIVAIGSLPKKIAIKRNHPQVDAINAASWIGLGLLRNSSSIPQRPISLDCSHTRRTGTVRTGVSRTLH